MHTATAFSHTMRSHGLDAKIDRGDGEQRLLACEFTTRFDGVGFLGADLVVEAHPLHLRSGFNLVEHGFDGAQLAIVVKQGVTGENRSTHHTGGTQVTHQLAGVDTADANNLVGFQIVIKAAGGAPITHVRAGIAHDVAGNPDSRGFRILPIDSRVPNMRERLYHDLTIVAGVRKRLLITGHAGRENDLPAGRADRAVRFTHIHLSVFENENGILRVKHHGFGIILVHQNPLIVKVFVPRIAAG